MTNQFPTVGKTTAAIHGMLTQNQVKPTAGGGKPFMKFDAKRTGEWLFGPGGEGVTEEIFALDLQSLMHGYILWHQKKADRNMVPINAPLPEPQEPIEYRDAKGKTQVDEPNEARYMEGTFEDGTEFVLEMSTHGGREAVDSVLKLLFSRAALHNPFIFPHIRLDTDSYDHSQYGLVYKPVLTVVAWYDEKGNLEPEDAEALEAPEAAPEPPEEAPPPRRKRKAAAKTAQAPEEPAPTVEEPEPELEPETAAPETEVVGETQEDPAPPRRRRRKPPAAA